MSFVTGGHCPTCGTPMYQMSKEDVKNAIHHLVRALSETEWRWRKYHLQQAWWSFTCILYGHGA